MDWIIGPGEKLLGSQKEIGTNFATADQLRREHEKLELKCTVSRLRDLFVFIVSPCGQVF